MSRDGGLRNGGMTLVEVMASMGILLVVFSGITYLILATQRHQMAVQEAEEALFHAEAVKERAATLPFNNVPIPDNGGLAGDGATDVSGNSGVTLSLSGETITVTYPDGPDMWGPGVDDWATWYANGVANGNVWDTDNIPDPLTITIQVSWIDGESGATRAQILTTARASSVP